MYSAFEWRLVLLARMSCARVGPVERKNMRFVPIKIDDQLDLQAIHRVRDRLVSRRTAVINQIRAFLLERGLVFAKRPAQLKAAIADVWRTPRPTLRR